MEVYRIQFPAVADNAAVQNGRNCCLVTELMKHEFPGTSNLTFKRQ